MSSELQVLKAELAALQSKVDELEGERVGDVRSSRRNMLRTLGAATVGAAAGGLALAQPASANNGDNFVLGNNDLTGNTATSSTILKTSSANGGLIVTDSNTTAGKGQTAAALVGIGTADGGLLTGLYAQGSQYGAKLAGETPLWLQSEATDAPTGTGEAGQFRQIQGDLYYSDGTKWTVLAGPNAAEYALASELTDYAMKTDLDAYALKTEIPAGVSGFTAVTPFRVYDSRLDMAPLEDGLLGQGQNRTVSIRDKRDVTTGAITGAGEVPATAIAVAYTVTIDNTAQAGFVTVADGDATEYTASSINWGSGNTAAIANSSIVKVNAAGEVKLFVDGLPGCATQVIIDIVGYYLETV